MIDKHISPYLDLRIKILKIIKYKINFMQSTNNNLTTNTNINLVSFRIQKPL